MMTCDKCPLAIENSFKMVLPRGDITKKLFFIGEAPGYKERKLGYTFVGKAGQLLQYFVNEYGLTYHSYFTNAIKCRPPRNRTPYMSEIKTCRSHLLKEFNDGRPRIVVLLGNSAVNAYFGCEVNSITKLNNRVMRFGNQIVVFGYHPSFILREESNIPEYHKMFKTIKLLYKYLVNRNII